MSLAQRTKAILRSVDGKVSVAFDCVKEVNSEVSTRVTRYPISTGADISDHAIVEPTTISLSVIHSDVSINLSAPISSEALYQMLLDLTISKAAVELTLYNRSDGSFLITGIRRVQNSDNRDALVCTIELTQLVLADLELPAIPVPKEIVAAIVKKQKDKGENALKDCKEPTKGKVDSDAVTDDGQTRFSLLRGALDLDE